MVFGLSWNLFWNLPCNLSWNLLCWESIKKSHGLLEFASLPPPRGGPSKIPGDHETLFIVRHVGIHVDFSRMADCCDLCEVEVNVNLLL